MTTIVTKNSSTPSAVPTTSDLVQGELAVNVTDKRIFTENASTQIVELGTNPSTVTTATATVTGTLTANGTFASNNAVITGGSINSTPIGATTASTVRGTTVTATTGFVGGLTGNVTGNLTGNVTGNVTGNLTGNVTGNVTASSGTTTLNNLVVNGTADFTNTKLTNVTTPTADSDAANKGYVDSTVAAVIDSAPAALDTLNELAAALGDDANFAGTVTTALATKLPLAGGTMTGAIAMGTAKITGLGDPTASQDAATKAYVDTQDATKLSTTGGTMSGAIAMGTNKITGVGNPTLAQDAATKDYVDDILGSATSAADSAAAASTSASNAATSASNAASSATASSNSATASANSATAAAASYDAFDDRYLGDKASDPTLDNDGNALLTGALYFNTTTDVMRVYNGSDWQDTAISPNSPTFNGTTTTDGLDLAAIAESKADTAVDVFVYDTRKDSDGGAWRKRTQHTSWYNETLNTATRGSRKEFPAVAVIVAESNKATIYDGDDPSLPMWATQASGTVIAGLTSISAKNGKLVFGSTSDYLAEFDLLNPKWATYNNAGYRIFSGNLFSDVGVILSTDSSKAILNADVNDVAMTVLPNAPIDAATGLPVPTIAVATNGGVSVIKDDGTVVDLTYSLSDTFPRFVDFVVDGLVYGLRRYSTDGNFYFVQYLNIPSSDTSAEPDRIYGFDSAGNRIKITKPLGGINTQVGHISNMSDDEFVFGSIAYLANTGTGIYGIKDSGTRGEQLFFNTTSTYNTGWMNGDIKLATLSDTDDTNITSITPLEDDFLSYADTAAMKAAGWSSATSTGTGDISLVSAAMQLDCDGTGNRARGSRSFTTVIGQTYVVEYSSTSNHHFRVGTTENGQDNLQLLNQPSGNNTFAYTFVTTATTTYVTWEGFNTSGLEPQIDNVSVRIAEEDRSVNDNGLQVFGTITKTPVATGADLVAYSGFSTSNYLEQPHNSDLDFGTGDFCVMGWVKVSAVASNETLIGLTDRELALQINSDKKIRVYTRNASNTLIFFDSTAVIPTTSWVHLCLTHSGGSGSIYIDGVLSSTSAFAADIDSGTGSLFVGVRYESGSLVEPADQSSLALWRISATAPTAEQIAKIYEDEKYLFQENAQATLYGSSDSVTALAYDDDTELLHVGTSAGRSVFQGLRRVDNTTDAVGAAISASNGLVAED